MIFFIYFFHTFLKRRKKKKKKKIDSMYRINARLVIGCNNPVNDCLIRGLIRRSRQLTSNKKVCSIGNWTVSDFFIQSDMFRNEYEFGRLSLGFLTWNSHSIARAVFHLSIYLRTLLYYLYVTQCVLTISILIAVMIGSSKGILDKSYAGMTKVTVSKYNVFAITPIL